MKPSFLVINKSSLLLDYKEQISSLFERCFLRKFDFELWHWLYFSNPIDNPIVSLAFLDQKLVGHYGFIPTKFNQFRSYTSITLMVDPNIQNPWIFLGMMNSALELLQKKADLLIAFPNRNSFPLFVKMLKWQLIQTFIAQVEKYTFPQDESQIFLDINDVDFLKWRLSKPNTDYFFQNELILKSYQNNEIDVVFSNTSASLYPSNQQYNILTSDLALIEKKIIDYPFVYKILNPCIDPSITIKPDLLMSDVF